MGLEHLKPFCAVVLEEGYPEGPWMWLHLRMFSAGSFQWSWGLRSLVLSVPFDGSALVITELCWPNLYLSNMNYILIVVCHMQGFAFLGWKYLGNANQSKFLVGWDVGWGSTYFHHRRWIFLVIKWEKYMTLIEILVLTLILALPVLPLQFFNFFGQWCPLRNKG